MCGRYTLFTAPEELARLFGVQLALPIIRPRYNIAPTQLVCIVRSQAPEGRALRLFRWGLIPSWAKDASIGSRMINARAETVAEKPAFRAAFKARRCLIPADGFYEWTQTGRGRQPFFIRRRDGKPLAFAGLWEQWVPPEGGPVESCTILTTTANGVMAPIHERMPVILDPAAWPAWLGEVPVSPEQLRALLRPAPDDLLEAYPVSRLVNNPGNDDAGCVAPAVGRSEQERQPLAYDQGPVGDTDA